MPSTTNGDKDGPATVTSSSCSTVNDGLITKGNSEDDRPRLLNVEDDDDEEGNEDDEEMIDDENDNESFEGMPN